MPFTVLKTFKRLQALTTDDAVLAEALDLSPSLLEVSNDRKSVKRIPPLPEDLNLDQRSIYAVRRRATSPLAPGVAPASSLTCPGEPLCERARVAVCVCTLDRPQKGFPRTMTQVELEAFFKALGNVKSVRMRRFPNKREFKVRLAAGARWTAPLVGRGRHPSHARARPSPVFGGRPGLAHGRASDRWNSAADGRGPQGSVFVEFGTVDEATSFVKAGCKHNDTQLKLMMK